jgi:hypothetical protein
MPDIAIDSYSVIYSAEWEFNKRDYYPLYMRNIAPPKRRLWDLTERQDGKDCEGSEWGANRHRKWCAILNQKQFDEFIRHCDLIADSTPTMGSIGAPGYGWGWAPAISFNYDGSEYYANAYVTPNVMEDEVERLYPGVQQMSEEEQQRITDELWEKLTEQILGIYGRGGTFEW